MKPFWKVLRGESVLQLPWCSIPTLSTSVSIKLHLDQRDVWCGHSPGSHGIHGHTADPAFPLSSEGCALGGWKPCFLGPLKSVWLCWLAVGEFAVDRFLNRFQALEANTLTSYNDCWEKAFSHWWLVKTFCAYFSKRLLFWDRQERLINDSGITVTNSPRRSWFWYVTTNQAYS